MAWRSDGGSVGREVADFVIPINWHHPWRLTRERVAYCHEDRILTGLKTCTPHVGTTDT